MRSPRHRLLGFASASLLVLSLAACATEPEAAPEPPPIVEPTPTETAAAPTPPGSRVPATCEQLFAGVDGFTGGPATEVELSYLPLEAILDQAGFEFCSVSGAIGGTTVEMTTVIGVGLDRTEMQQALEMADEYDLATGIGGELSSSECSSDKEFSYCMTKLFARGYLIEFSTSIRGPRSVDFYSSFTALAADLGERMQTWPDPVAAWEAPVGALTWANNCVDDVAGSDSAIRAALPFDSQPPIFFGSGDGFPLIYTAERLQVVTHCEWYRSGGSSGSASVAIAPGASWIVEAGGSLPGTPFDYPGAVAASVVDNPEYSNVSVWVVVDDSIIIVDMDTGHLIDDRPGEIEAAIRVVDALVAEFGAP